MYIIPKTWCDALGLNKIDDYFLGDGTACVIVEDTAASIMTEALKSIRDSDGYPQYFLVLTKPSNISGVRFIVSHLMNNDYMEALTGDDNRSLVSSITIDSDVGRFNEVAVLAHAEELRSEAISADAGSEPNDEQPPAPAIDDVPENVKIVIATFGDRMISLKLKSGKHVIYPAYNSAFCEDILPHINQLSTIIGKHICLVNNHSHLVKASQNSYDDILFLVFANVAMSSSKISFADIITSNDSVSCLGQKCTSLLVPRKGKSGNVNPYSVCSRIWVDESNGVVFAIALDGILFITACIDDYSIVFQRLIQKWNKDISTKEEDVRLNQNNYDKEKIDFLKIAAVNANIYIEDIKSQSIELSSKIGELQAELVETMKMYRQLNEIMTSFNYDVYYDKIKSTMEKQFDAIKKMSNITSFGIDKDGIIRLTTAEIKCKDTRSGKIHNIGRLSISLNILSPKYNEDKSIVIKNLSHMVEGFNGDVMVAPHIYKDGHICHGNLSNAVIQQYADRDVYGLVESILAFVESANTDDLAGKAIHHWPLAVNEDSGDDEFIANIKKGVS